MERIAIMILLKIKGRKRTKKKSKHNETMLYIHGSGKWWEEAVGVGAEKSVSMRMDRCV